MGEERGLWGVGPHGLLLGQGKVSFERLTPKRARKLRCGTQKWARRWKGARNYDTELNHRCGEVSSLSGLACAPLSHLILLPCACYIGYTYRILHGKCGRTVFSYELLTYFNRKSEISVTKTAISEIPYKAFSIVFVRYSDVHHWLC